MALPFDTDAENAKLATIHEREEEDLTRLIAERNGFSYTDLTIVPVDVDALRLIPEKEAQDGEIIAFSKEGKHLSVALRDPNNLLAREVERALESRGFILTRFLISKKSLDSGLNRYAELSQASESKAGVFDIRGEELSELRASLTSLSTVRTALDEVLTHGQRAQASRALEIILAAAFALRASDIHIEPEEESIRLRLRLDGQLTDTYTLSPHAYRLLSSRIKLLSGLKLNIRDRAQDGRFSVPTNDIDVEIRTSLIPGAYGESFVMRILDPSILGLSVESLGIRPELLARLSSEIRRPTGMLLVTGPTGSGKTTTLYAFLRDIHAPEVKIVTIEDPIEYHLPGVVQTQTDGKNYTFASGLRSVLRQDPDVIMVGEIRDHEVADTAIQAALTGHFVFSTLHTNNAAGAFPRLVDLGTDSKTFASAVTVAMAQRLVRTLDPGARKQIPATEEQKTLIERVLEPLVGTEYYPAVRDLVWVPDPQNPDQNGYKGRTGVYEAIFMDDELGTFLRDNPSEGDIAKHARRQGFLTMAQDGVLKALAGITSLDEVLRVVDVPRA